MRIIRAIEVTEDIWLYRTMRIAMFVAILFLCMFIATALAHTPSRIQQKDAGVAEFGAFEMVEIETGTEAIISPGDIVMLNENTLWRVAGFRLTEYRSESPLEYLLVRDDGAEIRRSREQFHKVVKLADAYVKLYPWVYVMFDIAIAIVLGGLVVTILGIVSDLPNKYMRRLDAQTILCIASGSTDEVCYSSGFVGCIEV